MNSAPLRILIHQDFASELSRVVATPHTLRTIQTQSDSEIAETISETDVLVSGEFRAAWRDRKNALPRLVQTVGAGLDAIDLASLPAGCVVCNVYGHERGVAEHAFLLMLALQRQLFKMDAALRQGDWTPQQIYLPELRNRRLLILGLGHIGAELVRWGRFLDMKITALTRSPSKERGEQAGADVVVGLDELDQYLGEADFIVVAIPATADTANLIGEKEFQQMKPGAFLINVGRATVVNEAALYEALRTHRIAGAGLDVWYQYPDSAQEKRLPSRLPFQELDNVIMTPHKPTVETMEYRWKQIAENIRRFARGEPLENVVFTAAENNLP
jgi:phosphoglycerate dehydrogenase-like enzyme